MVAEILQKYIWLIQTFIRVGDRGLTLEELSDRWENRFGQEYPRRTFANHREAIADLFNINIECNRSGNRYFIRYTEDVSDEHAASAWLINTFTVNNMLSLGKARLSGRVSVEDVPSGHKYLTSIMDAMLDGSVLKVKHKKYVSEKASEYTLRPYALKEYSKRWYLVAWCEERDAIRTFGLDRITSLETTEEHFSMPEDFDVDTLFADCYGVYLPENEPCEILFRTTAKEANYRRDLPIHSSQKEISEDPDGVTFSIFVCPNESLIMEFAKAGASLEVLSPGDVRDAVIGRLREGLENYGRKTARRPL